MSITSSSSNRNAQKFRIAFLGDQGVGKSSIIQRYINNRYQQQYQATVGIDFNVKDINKNGQYYKLQMWDTAGQQRYRSLIPTYLKNAHCVIFIYDITKPSTLASIKQWYQMFIQNQQAPGYLVGNKTDLNSVRKVTRQQAENLSKQLGLGYQQVSAKNGKRVNQLFLGVLDRILTFKSKQSRLEEQDTSRHRLENNNNNIDTNNQQKNDNTKQKKIKLNQKYQGWIRKKCCFE